MLPRLPPLRPLHRLTAWWHSLSPTGLFVASFALLIALGTAGLLWLPNLYTGEGLSVIDALFTITSAVCVTGLVVVDTATYFTSWGQAWVLVFIQLGGLGLFTLSTLIIGALGRRLSLRSEMIAGPPIELSHRRTVVALTMAVCKFTFAIEAAGAVLLWIQWAPRYGVAAATWHAVFHSVSAFCNAGFSTFTGNMVGFADNPVVLQVISWLIILGGTGWLSIEETMRWWKARKSERPLRLSSHTWSALLVTGVLLVGGAALFAAFEWRGVLAPFGLVDKISNAWFMSAVPRTAGFQSISYTEVTNASAYLTILLMFIGGSPGSTAGGIKTTSFAVLVALAIARVRSRRYVSLHGRTIPEATVQRAVSLTMVAGALLAFTVFALSFTEEHATVAQARQNFLPHLFEATSAFGTVGLSMDLSPTLSKLGKLLIIGLMFVGRVGPLAFFAAISLPGSDQLREYRPAREDVITG